MKSNLVLLLILLGATQILAQTPKFNFTKVGRDLRKEAKKYEKEGWSSFPGALPISQQLNNSYTKQTATNEEGFPMWIVANGASVAQNQAAAEMQASELAKNNLVGLIETNMRNVVETDLANNQISSEDAVSLTKTIQVSVNKVSKKLGMLQPVFKVYRQVGRDKNIEVQITLAYNYEMARKALMDEARMVLESESEDVRKKYESYLNPDNFKRGDVKNTNQK